MKSDISARYYIAEATVWLLSTILIVSRFLGLAPSQPLPLLNVILSNQQDFLRVLTVLLLATIFYLFFEWKQSSPEARRSNWARTRASFTIIFSCASIWLCYPLIAANTQFAGISPAWYFVFFAMGICLGFMVSILVFSSLMIRTPTEAKDNCFPRIPVATRAQYKPLIPAIFLLLSIYYILCYLGPSVINDVGFFLVATPFLYIIVVDFISLFLKHDDNGKRIPYKKRLETLKKIYDQHDYNCFLGINQNKIKKESGIPTKTPPKTVQKIIRERNFDDRLIHYNIQMQEKFQLRFYFKDENPKNKSPENQGIRIQKQQGKEDLIRVLLIVDEAEEEDKEVDIPINLIETYAEEYILAYTENADLSIEKMFTYAINKAVSQTMTNHVGLLHIAVMAGHEKAVKELLKVNIDVNEQDPANGWTALHCAAAQGYPHIMQLLLDAGANPDIKNLSEFTPLMFGVHYDNIEICKILLEYGANPDLQEGHRTPLMNSIYLGHANVAEMLLNAGARIDIKDRNNMTALDYAHKHKQGNIAKLIRKSSRKTLAD